MWRDVWISVSSKYYNLLHSLEEDDLLDISCTDDIFCVHYGFLPRPKRDLEIFTEAWNHHPLRTEGNRSPTQIWDLAQTLDNTNVNPENLAVSVLYTVLVFPGTKCKVQGVNACFVSKDLRVYIVKVNIIINILVSKLK